MIDSVFLKHLCTCIYVQTLASYSAMSDIIITEVDKGDTTVVTNVLHLLKLAYEHLLDQKTYLLLVKAVPNSLLSKLPSVH